MSITERDGAVLKLRIGCLVPLMLGDGRQGNYVVAVELNSTMELNFDQFMYLLLVFGRWLFDKRSWAGSRT